MRSSPDIHIAVEGLPPAKQISPLLAPSHTHRGRVLALLHAAKAAVPAESRPFASSLSLTLTLFVPDDLPPGDPTNFLGGVADVLQEKQDVWDLGELRSVALYRNDAQLRHLEFRQEVGDRLRYELHLRQLDPRPLPMPLAPGRRALRASALDEAIHLKMLARVDDVALDFVNALEGLRSQERVIDYEELIAWCRANRVVPPQLAEDFRRVAESQSLDALEAFQRARTLSAALRRAFAGGYDSSAATTVSDLVATCASMRVVRPDAKGNITSDVVPRTDVLESILCPIVDSAITLLAPRFARACESVLEPAAEECSSM